MIYKCEACGGALVYDPDLGKMKCTQCGQTSERRFHMKLKEVDPDTEEKEDGKRSFDNLWFGLDKDQKWHGEKEIQINPDWNADLLAFEMRNNRPEDISAASKQTEAEDISEKSERQAQDTAYTGDRREMQGERLMSVQIFRCTSCGAQIMIHGNERATFCSFCGQPTVIFDRESKEVWPDYIIPFSITEQQAVDAIKEKFGTGRYVPREIKHPKIDKIRGIYIPYWLYTVYMRKKANLHLVTSNEAEKKEPENIFNAGMNRNQSFYTMLQSSKKMGLYPGSFQNQKYDAETRSVSVGINEKTDMFADAYGNFEQVTFDASRKLDDRLSSRLEPYHMEALKPFDPSYLSGFYADRYDVPSREAAPDIHQRISDAMDKAMIEDTGTTYIEKSIEQYSVDKIEYALLPAWFMTFWYRHELYTILVNGQTGKVVGNIPVNKRGFISDAVMTGVVCCTIGAVVFYEINQGIAKGYGFFHEYGGSIIVFLFMLAAGLFTRNLSKYNRYKHDKERLASSTTTDYVKERQDKTWIR